MVTETLPGFCDVHLHFREPGDEKETIEDGSRAGISNGVTHGSLMPNLTEADGTKIPIEDTASLGDQFDRIKKTSWMDLGVNFLAWGQNIDQLEKVKNSVIGYKAYCDWSTGGFNMPTANERREVTAKIPAGKIMMLHAEGGTLDEMLGYGEEFDTRMHVLHISTEGELESAYKAKQSRPGKVTIGVNPAYLHITEEHQKILTHPGYAKVKPPPRHESDRLALWKGVQTGVIDIFETDHAPHRRSEKENPDFDKVPFGLSMLDTVFPLLWTDVVEGRLTKAQLIAMYSTNPRRIFNIRSSPGSYFQFDPNERFKIGPPYFSKSGWSPWEGQELQGKVTRTFLAGKCIYDRGEFLGKPDGQVILPTR